MLPLFAFCHKMSRKKCIFRVNPVQVYVYDFEPPSPTKSGGSFQKTMPGFLASLAPWRFPFFRIMKACTGRAILINNRVSGLLCTFRRIPCPGSAVEYRIALYRALAGGFQTGREPEGQLESSSGVARNGTGKQVGMSEKSREPRKP